MSTASHTQSLGPKTKVFHNNPVISTLVSIGICFTLMCAARMAAGPDNLCFPGLFFFLLLGGIFRLPGALRNRHKRVTMHENGFVCHDGERQDVILWKDIITVRMVYEVIYSELFPSLTSIKIERRDRIISIDTKDYWRGGRLGEYIVQKTLMQFNSRLSQLEKQKKATLNELGNKAWESRLKDERYIEVYGTLEELNATLSQIQQEIDAKQNAINQETDHLNAAKLDFDNRLKSTENQRQVAVQKLSVLQTNQKNIELRINQLQTTASQLQQNIQNMQAQVNQLEGSSQPDKAEKIASLHSTIAAMQAQINHSAAQLEATKAELETNRTEQVPVQDEVDGYNQLIWMLQEQSRSALSAIQEKLRSLQQDLLRENEKKNKILNEMAGLMPDLGNQVYRYRPSSDALSAAYAKVDAVNSDIKEVNDQINFTQASQASVNTTIIKGCGLTFLAASPFLFALIIQQIIASDDTGLKLIAFLVMLSLSATAIFVTRWRLWLSIWLLPSSVIVSAVFLGEIIAPLGPKLTLIIAILGLVALFFPGFFPLWRKKFGWVIDIWVIVIAVLATAISAFYVASYLQQTTEVRPFAMHMEQYSNPSSFREGNPPAYIVGKVITIDTNTHKIDDIFFDLPKKLRASSPDEVGTIIWINCKEDWVRTYASGVKGYQTTCVVSVIDYTNALIVGNQVLVGFEPPPNINQRENFYGGKPTDKILEYIMSLPMR